MYIIKMLVILNTIFYCFFYFSKANAIDQYSVKEGESLWSISKKYTYKKNISTQMIIQAIKGINFEKYPSIIDNSLKTKQIIIIPTTEEEIKDGIFLYSFIKKPNKQSSNLTRNKTDVNLQKSENKKSDLKISPKKNISSGGNIFWLIPIILIGFLLKSIYRKKNNPIKKHRENKEKFYNLSSKTHKESKNIVQ